MSKPPEAPKALPPEVARKLIFEQGDKFFAVTFVKRTDGSIREMVARRHVMPASPKLEPGVRRAEDDANACVTVFDVQAQGYRRIPLDAVLSIRAAGKEVSSA